MKTLLLANFKILKILFKVEWNKINNMSEKHMKEKNNKL